MSIERLILEYLPPNLEVNVYFWPKQRSTFSQINIAIVKWHKNSILYIDGTSWNGNITRLIYIAYTIS